MLNYFSFFKFILVKEKRLADADGNTTVEITVFSVTHLYVRNVFLQNLPEEISDHCFLIDIVPECNKGESETLALLRCSEGENMLLLKPETKEVGMYTKREGVPQSLNSPRSGIRVWVEVESAYERCMCIYGYSMQVLLRNISPYRNLSVKRSFGPLVTLLFQFSFQVLTVRVALRVVMVPRQKGDVSKGKA